MSNKDKALKETIMKFDIKKWSFIKKQKVNNNPIEQRAVIYCRVSSKKQVTEWNGLDSQKRKCTDWCWMQNPPIIVDKVFLEGWVSWAKKERKALRELLNHLKDKNKKYAKITHLIVSEASRISRPDNLSEALTIEAEIESYWVKIIKLDSPTLDNWTDEGQLLNQIQYVIAWYERKKIARRASDWRRNRLLNGFRPFPSPPLWYIRDRISVKDYQDLIDEDKWPLIKKGLEMYANNVILTDADLWRFWNKNGLLTNTKWATKLQRTFIEKTMQLHRILFYAWYIIFPERWVDEPIEGQQEWLISLSTAHKIIKKQQWRKTSTNKVQSGSNRMSDAHPMRWVITCLWCKRKFTSRNTSKKIWPEWNKKKVLYPYYWCNNRDCKMRVNVNKEKLEKEFIDFLEKMKLPIWVLKLIEVIFKKSWEENKKTKQSQLRIKRNKIKAHKKRQSEIEEVLPRTQNIKLYQKLEEEWATLDAKIEIIQDELENNTFTEVRQKALLQKVQHLFEDPLAIRELGNQTMRWLLITVRFGDNLTYTKKEWLQTSWSGTLYAIFSSLKENISVNWATRDSNPGPWA